MLDHLFVLGFLLSMVVITLTGILARHFIGKLFIDYFDGIMKRIHLVSAIYKSFKHIINNLPSNPFDL